LRQQCGVVHVAPLGNRRRVSDSHNLGELRAKGTADDTTIRSRIEVYASGSEHVSRRRIDGSIVADVAFGEHATGSCADQPRVLERLHEAVTVGRHEPLPHRPATPRSISLALPR
jgi:hypothetical protein